MPYSHNRPRNQCDARAVRRKRAERLKTVWGGFLALLLPALWGCPAGAPGALPDLLGTSQTDPPGYVGILYLNRSSLLAQPIVALSYPDTPPVVWVNSVAPDSWDSLLVECGMNQLTFVGTVPVTLATGEAGERVDYTGAPLVTREQIVCGSLVVIEISDAPADAGGPPLVAEVRTVPESLQGVSDRLKDSPIAPTPATGLMVLRPEIEEDLTADVQVSWEDDQGLIYALDWVLSGRSPAVASLVECPIVRAGWGSLNDATVPGARVGDGDVPVAAPAPLVGGVDFACGDSIVLRATGDPNDPAGVQLSAQASNVGSEIRFNRLDLFGNIRAVLDTTGFTGKLSNSNLLLPPIGANVQLPPH